MLKNLPLSCEDEASFLKSRENIISCWIKELTMKEPVGNTVSKLRGFAETPKAFLKQFHYKDS